MASLKEISFDNQVDDKFSTSMLHTHWSAVLQVDETMVIPVCRSMCLQVKSRCEPVLIRFNFGWPAMLDCSKLPERSDRSNLCIDPPALEDDDPWEAQPGPGPAGPRGGESSALGPLAPRGVTGRTLGRACWRFSGGRMAGSMVSPASADGGLGLTPWRHQLYLPMFRKVCDVRSEIMSPVGDTVWVNCEWLFYSTLFSCKHSYVVEINKRC